MAPVVFEDRSDARNSTALAQSSGLLARPFGWNEPENSISSADRGVNACSSDRPKFVSRTPGAMALILMPSSATSIARDFVRRTPPAFETPYGTPPKPTMPATEHVL